MDFGDSPDEAAFTTRAASTAIAFDPTGPSGVYSQWAGALPASYQRINYWRMLSLFPICWDLTPPAGNPEDASVDVADDLADRCVAKIRSNTSRGKVVRQVCHCGDGNQTRRVTWA